MEFDAVRMIKIDVEGLELQVLKGGLGTLRRNHYPPIIAEAWTNEWFRERRAELLGWLTGLGYQIKEWGDDCIALHPAHGEMPAF
ncbi:FkbM family methyltransferase [Paraburkholderia aspalathi]